MTVFTRRAVVLVAFALCVTTVPAVTASAAPDIAVIVQAGSADAAATAVRAVHGTVTRHLSIVNGVAARVPSDSLDDLAARRGVRAVTPDTPVRVQSTTSGNEQTVNPVATREVNADRLWAEGITGKGVRVALVDTGITPGLADLAGRVVPIRRADVTGSTLDLALDPRARVDCVDFSGDGDCLDRYGHGTFMAGLIAGNGALSQGRYKGVAPEAELVSIKIAGRDGSADVSKVLAAIQWVVSFREEYGIGVLNLSLGTDSTVHYTVDPLNLAVQRAWVSGVAVVVSAGNRGASSPGKPTISKPADDPFVITVGAVDDRETPAIDDDRLPAFSSTGPTAHDLAKPDLVAPGGRVVSLRSPGSFIEEKAPGGGINATYRRGSGTSMSAAVTSGVAALVLSSVDWSPNRLKHVLVQTTRKVAARDPMAVGTGLVDAFAAVHKAPEGVANGGATSPVSDGSGSLEDSRGTVRVTGPCDSIRQAHDPECEEPLDGERTAQGRDWDGDEYADESDEWTGSDLAGSSWYESQWAQSAVQGSSWYGSSWYGTTWEGSSWYGSSWYGSSDPTTSYGTAVQGSSWYGSWG